MWGEGGGLGWERGESVRGGGRVEVGTRRECEGRRGWYFRSTFSPFLIFRSFDAVVLISRSECDTLFPHNSH